MEKILRNKTTIMVFLLPALLLYSAVVFVPIVTSLYYSFFSWNVISPRKYVGIHNFTRMFTIDPIFYKSIGNMLFILVTSLVLQQIFGFFLAILLTGKIKGKEWFKNIYFLPAVISSVAVGMMWSFIYNPQIGILNNLLKVIGLGSWQHEWLTEPHIAMWAITVVVSWQYVGYTMILYIAAIQNVSHEIFESARMDGATGWKMIRHMTIPLVRPIIKVNTILIAIGSLKFFDLIYVMTQGGPGNNTQVLASYLYYRSFDQFEYGYGDALSVILLIFCLVTTLIINSLFRRWEKEY